MDHFPATCFKQMCVGKAKNNYLQYCNYLSFISLRLMLRLVRLFVLAFRNSHVVGALGELVLRSSSLQCKDGKQVELHVCDVKFFLGFVPANAKDSQIQLFIYILFKMPGAGWLVRSANLWRNGIGPRLEECTGSHC